MSDQYGEFSPKLALPNSGSLNQCQISTTAKHDVDHSGDHGSRPTNVVLRDMLSRQQ